MIDKVRRPSDVILYISSELYMCQVLSKTDFSDVLCITRHIYTDIHHLHFYNCFALKMNKKIIILIKRKKKICLIYLCVLIEKLSFIRGHTWLCFFVNKVYIVWINFQWCKNYLRATSGFFFFNLLLFNFSIGCFWVVPHSWMLTDQQSLIT